MFAIQDHHNIEHCDNMAKISCLLKKSSETASDEQNYRRFLRPAQNTRRKNSIKYLQTSLVSGFLYALRVFAVLLIIVLCGILKNCSEEHEVKQASDPEISHAESHSDLEVPQAEDHAEHPGNDTKMPGRDNDNARLSGEKTEDNIKNDDICNKNLGEDKPENKQAERLIYNSVIAYIKTGHPCACPYSLMRNGRLCEGHSAYSRPGGKHPLCYISDVKGLDDAKGPDVICYHHPSIEPRISPKSPVKETKDNNAIENSFGMDESEPEHLSKKEAHGRHRFHSGHQSNVAAY